MIDHRAFRQDDELFDLLRDVAEAIDSGAASQVKALLDGHPQEAEEIKTFIDDYIAYRERERQGEAAYQELTHLEQQIHEMAHELSRLPRSLAGEARRRGKAVQGLARSLGLSLDVFSKLDTRAVRVETVPIELIRQLGAELSLSFWQVAAYLRQPRDQAAYYADRPPDAPAQQTFDDVLKSSRQMPRDAVESWLAKERLADVLIDE
jgi:hypothetical protein